MNTADTNEPNIIPFKKAAALISLGGGLYRCPLSGRFYARPWDGSRQRKVKLMASTERKARIELGALLAHYEASRHGQEENPFVKRFAMNVGGVLDYYLSAGCPQRSGATDRRDNGEEVRRIAVLREFWEAIKPHTIRAEDLRAYLTWRKARIKGKTGGERIIDLELTTLSNAFDYAALFSRTTGLKTNPIKQRQRFRQSRKIRHCRDVMPESGDELHQIAARLFESPQSEVLGWQLLFEAMTGVRTQALLKWRLDAKPGEPGYVDDEGRLWLWRSETHKGTYPWAQIHPALAQCLAAHKKWHAERFKGATQWYFPGRNKVSPVGKCALTHSLPAAAKELGLRHCTPHGLRAFFVTVMRGQGMIDADIALRIGHRTGGRLIVEVYGEILPVKLDWMPSKNSPAWAKSK